jgi:glycosyltransferase involved in cell wall biosynthesis
MVLAKPFETVFEKPATGKEAQISVLMSCYKYGKEATEALASLLEQTEPRINISLVDDHSPDNSVAVLTQWFATHGDAEKLERVRFVRHLQNQGPSQTRNTALSLIETPYTFILDADNQLYPRALKVLREALENSGYPMAYSLVERFGLEPGIMNNSVWIPEKFSYGNYIDTLAMVRTDVLKELGGYRQMPKKFGWEDYDLWCSFVDRDLKGCHVPQILCRYSVHDGSITQTSAKAFTQHHIEKVREDFEAHHKMRFLF